MLSILQAKNGSFLLSVWKKVPRDELPATPGSPFQIPPGMMPEAESWKEGDEGDESYGLIPEQQVVMSWFKLEELVAALLPIVPTTHDMNYASEGVRMPRERPGQLLRVYPFRHDGGFLVEVYGAEFEPFEFESRPTGTGATVHRFETPIKVVHPNAQQVANATYAFKTVSGVMAFLRKRLA